jgi:hypothetical protein
MGICLAGAHHANMVSLSDKVPIGTTSNLGVVFDSIPISRCTWCSGAKCPGGGPEHRHQDRLTHDVIMAIVYRHAQGFKPKRAPSDAKVVVDGGSTWYYRALSSIGAHWHGSRPWTCSLRFPSSPVVNINVPNLNCMRIPIEPCVHQDES